MERIHCDHLHFDWQLTSYGLLYERNERQFSTQTHRETERAADQRELSKKKVRTHGSHYGVN